MTPDDPVVIVLDDNPISAGVLKALDELGCMNFVTPSIRPIHQAFGPAVRDAAYDVSELAIVTALQAVEHRKPIIPLPITIAARFQHLCIVQDGDRDNFTPQDLRGKRVGVRAYSQTTGAWVRTILEMEYGVPASSIQWITQVSPHVLESTEPENVIRNKDALPLDEMLRRGIVDAAIFGNDMPGHSWIKPVIDNPHEVALASYYKFDVVPINHIIAVSREFAQRDPEAVKLIYRLFGESKSMLSDPSKPDLLPFGPVEMRSSVEALLGSARSQGLIKRPLSFDDIFGEGIKLVGAWT